MATIPRSSRWGGVPHPQRSHYLRITMYSTQKTTPVRHTSSPADHECTIVVEALLEQRNNFSYFNESNLNSSREFEAKCFLVVRQKEFRGYSLIFSAIHSI